MTKRNPNAGPSGKRYDWSAVPELAASGATCAEVARVVGCTPTAVAAWTKRRGITLALPVRASTEDRYGCSLEVARRLNGGLPLNTTGAPASRYRDAWRRADVRDIAWEMTFPEWMQIWREAGGLELRGREPDALCMARHGDTGPYRIGNVSIITTRQNSQDGLKNKPRKIPPRMPGYGRGYFYDSRQTRRPYRVEVCGRYIDSFATETEAVSAYRAAASAAKEGR
jgi:hypothetical protein